MTNILFAGCSHTESSGFLPENLEQYHWPSLLTTHYSCSSQNIARGGMSNTEIFLRTTEALTYCSYDLVVVVWSEIGRDWVYYNKNNVDEHTNINYGGTNHAFADLDEVRMYSKLHHAYFNNLYVKLKHWLLMTISLADSLNSQGIPYVFVKGFDNYVSDFVNVSYGSQGIENLSEALRDMLDFDNRTDPYIIDRINSIKHLITVSAAKHWIDFEHYSFMNEQIQDLADDGGHPGPICNQDLTNKLIQYIDSNCLTFHEQNL